jgi:F-type H+-transporting ATPase subunit b
MLIDWFTVIAQAINFLILVWLLKRFLYRPILDAIDAREKRIAAKIADADAKETEAQKQRDVYQQKNQDMDQQRSTLLNEAVEAAKAERTQLLDAARQDAEDLRIKLERGLRNEQHSLSDEISRRAREEIFAIARKALSDLAGVSLEQRMTEIFLDRLRDLGAKEMADMKSAFKLSRDPLLVRTAFALSDQQKEDIEKAVLEILDEKQATEFIVDADLVSGIEISSDGRKVAWSIADYVDSLASNVDDLLKNTSGTGETPVEDAAAAPVQGTTNNVQ